MAALLMPLFFLLVLLAPINDSIIRMATSTYELAKLDKKIGDKAEELSTTINFAIQLNSVLKGFHLACPAATVSGSLPALQAEAQIIRVQQDLLLFEARLSLQSISSLEFSKTLNPPERGSGGPCELPDVLQCLDKEILVIRHRDGSKPAGVKATDSGLGMNCSEVRWAYSDERVRVL